MTLDPVFRSKEAVNQMMKDGYLENLADSLECHRETIRHIRGLMPNIIEEAYLIPGYLDDNNLVFLQNHFFLILFHSIFKAIGCSEINLRFYSRINFCIKGIVTAGDNIFDDETKDLISLDVGNNGSRFKSILQLLCFDRLIYRVCDDEIRDGWLSRKKTMLIQKEILNRLIYIGKLEGSEENGVDEILPVDEMIEKVHRVRGGALFSLAFIAPMIIEGDGIRDRLEVAENAVRKLGIAFQIVDDLTDFEFDLSRRSHNILCAAATYNEDEKVRSAIKKLLNGKKPEPNMVEGIFSDSARKVLKRAEEEGKKAFDQLAGLGFWFPPEHSSDVIRAIVGIEGIARMEKLTSA